MKKYPYIQQLIEEGYEVCFNTRAMGKTLIIVTDEGGTLIMFSKGRLKYEKFMEKLENYAKEFLEDGIINDEINKVREKLY